MSPMVKVLCPAKLNLFLEVLERRPDGYHEIETVMHAVDLYDELVIEPLGSEAIELWCDEPGVPTDERNLVVRAARLLRERTGCRRGARIELLKRIPLEAGLGGGSSDGAGALIGLNLAWGLGLGRDELATLAAEVGSDVPFFLVGGTALCTGRGERVRAVACPRPLEFVVVCPPVRVSTAEAYRRLPSPLTWRKERATMLLDALAGGDAERIGRCLFNRLEQAAFAIAPSLAALKAQMIAAGCYLGVALSGSGSSLFGACPRGSETEPCEAAEKLRVGCVYRVRSTTHGAKAQLA